MKLKDACEKRVYNGKHVTFYTKNVFAQNFVIKTINEKLKFSGIKAKGPRPLGQNQPNLHAEFPAVLKRIQPEMILKEAISMHVAVECDSIKICNIKQNKRTGGKSLACELPADVLEKVQKWALENKAIHFSLFTKRVRFWTSKKTQKEVTTPLAANPSAVAPMAATPSAASIVAGSLALNP